MNSKAGKKCQKKDKKVKKIELRERKSNHTSEGKWVKLECDFAAGNIMILWVKKRPYPLKLKYLNYCSISSKKDVSVRRGTQNLTFFLLNLKVPIIYRTN